VSGPANAIMGDQDEPTAMPETTVSEEVLVEERKLAKYSKTAEFKRLKEFLEARISFYQNYLPDGRTIKEVQGTSEIIALNWKVANAIITEFQNVLNEYNQAAEVVSASEQG
jgi:hypothetical protein